ncbi:hypothetical protein [Mycolicibacterium holsaticum]|uniref:hypothetical protein n=1 Tax=Mycolicibacterium holsaticum TaxID=152142 RepID=UPI001F37652B|nr:hypothetical protein [Mycolicibacterium holsaticum]
MFDDLGQLIDEMLADAVVDAELSIRAAAQKAGLTENAIGPRLANTPKLAGYAADGRVNTRGVERARYDKETGIAPPPVEAKPMQFKRRRRQAGPGRLTPIEFEAIMTTPASQAA